MKTSNVGVLLVGAIEGLSPSREELLLLKSCSLSGVTLFKRNISDDRQQLVALTQEIQSSCGTDAHSAIIAIDQEGGRVRRILDKFPNLGPCLTIGNGAADAETLKIIFDYGIKVGQELLRLGVNVNFAPVVDILTNPDNTAIGDRCFGTELEPTRLRAESFLNGMQSAGVMGCLKHFPGQGDANADTHLQSSSIDLPRETLWAREIACFVPLLKKSPLVMISHCIYSAFDAVPATLSKVIIGDVLRKRLGFDGVVVSDDMRMSAIAQDEHSWLQSVIAAVRAGIDLILVCRDIQRSVLAFEALSKEAERDSLFAKRIDESANRVLKFRMSHLKA